MSFDPDRAAASAAQLGLGPERAYASYRAKPLAATLQQAQAIRTAVGTSGTRFFLTQSYTG